MVHIFVLNKLIVLRDVPNLVFNLQRDHPFKTLACLKAGGVKNLPNLPTDSTKNLPTVGG